MSRLLRKRYGLVAAVSQCLRGAVLIILALVTGLTASILLFWFVYMSMGLGNSPHATLINREVPAERRSTMLSVQSLVSYLGAIGGSIGLGYLAEAGSVSLAWLSSGSALLASALLYQRIDAQCKVQNEQTPAIVRSN